VIFFFFGFHKNTWKNMYTRPTYVCDMTNEILLFFICMQWPFRNWFQICLLWGKKRKSHAI